MNRPIVANDPTGHKCVGEVEECLNKDGRPINGAGGGPTSDGNPDPENDGSEGGGNNPQDMETSENGKDFIKYFEMGKRPPAEYPYVDMGGTCTIGYGHVLYNPGKEGCSGWPNKTYNDNPLSVQGAEDLFQSDIATFEDLIRETIVVNLSQGQFDALVSYTFNSGDQANNPYFVKGIPELINSGKFEEAAAAIASGPITSGAPPLESPKLVERRQAEATLFLYGTYGNYVPWKP